ncbi:MAG: O-antigen ligase family protein [Bacilli bacterium]|nr:O-antigen ligase family protein [Bacilli bacterium]
MSIIINVLIENFTFERILAAINVSSMWIISALFYKNYKHADIDKKLLAKICLVNLVVLYLLAILFFCLTLFDVPEFYLFNRPLYGIEYANGGLKYRFIGFMEYSNLIVTFTMINTYFALFACKKNTYKIALVILGFLPIFLEKSRFGILAYLILIFMLYFLGIEYKRERIYFLLLGAPMIIVLAMSMIDINLIINYRPGSNRDRFDIYYYSIKSVVDGNIFNMFMGKGVKAYHTYYPMGSHSTYLGFFYKMGITGIVNAIFLVISCLKYILSKRNYVGVVFLSVLFVFFALEDMDGANWLLCVIAAFVAIAGQQNEENKKRLLEYEKIERRDYCE